MKALNDQVSNQQDDKNDAGEPNRVFPSTRRSTGQRVSGYRRTTQVGLRLLALAAALTSASVASAETPRQDTVAAPPDAAQSTELADRITPTTPSASENQGLALHGHFGTVGGNFLVGGGMTSPWLAETMRFNLSMGAAYYPEPLAADPETGWTPFGLGHARVEVGPGFWANAPVRPYGFGGVAVALLPDSLSDSAVGFGGFGGVGLEAAFPGLRNGMGPVTYAIELAGIGSGAQALTPDGKRNLFSGVAANAVIRGYVW